ncbi:secretory lipase [Apiospora arundinis]
MRLQHLLLSGLPLASAAPAAVDAAPPSALCDAKCMEEFQSALASERAGWVTAEFSDDPFYKTPANASGAKPGDVLSWQDISSEMMDTNFTGVPEGMSVSRFLYMSEDIDRKPVPASAFVLLPYGMKTFADPDATTFKTVAWAHGTAGHARQCAPSNSQKLYYEWEAPFYYASHGYAVVAADYAGLGTDIPGGFQYEAGFLHAADVAYSMVAARKVIGHLLSEEWAVLGHSEGGMTAWRVNERLAMPGQEELLKAGKFLGAVAAAPALRPADLIPKSIELAGEGPLGDVVSVYVLQSVSQLYPGKIVIDDILTDEAKKLLPLIDQACLTTGETVFQNLTTKQIYKSTAWLTSPEFKEWQVKYNGAGPHALAAPMLVVQGKGDTLTYAENCEWDFDQTCSAFPQSSAELFFVPALGHDPAFRAATSYYWPWVERLFHGAAPAAAGCKKTEVKPVNDRFKKGTAG